MDIDLTPRLPEREHPRAPGDDGGGVWFEARVARLADGDPRCHALDQVARLLDGSPRIACVDPQEESTVVAQLDGRSVLHQPVCCCFGIQPLCWHLLAVPFERDERHEHFPAPNRAV